MTKMNEWPFGAPSILYNGCHHQGPDQRHAAESLAGEQSWINKDCNTALQLLSTEVWSRDWDSRASH